MNVVENKPSILDISYKKKTNTNERFLYFNNIK